MSAVRNKVCVVTGAGSGIGRALALELAARGARVAISDLNESGLAETARLANGIEFDSTRLDVTDRQAVEDYAAAVAERMGGTVHQIYNNAGLAFSRPVQESGYADFERVLDVNLWGVIHGTLAFLPALIASGDGHVVNVSSLNGFATQPGSSHYVTSKFAVRGFTESVRADMLIAKHPVKVTVVHPGGVKTGIADNALASAEALGYPITDAERQRREVFNDKLLRMDPAKAARIIVDGVERDRSRVLVGNDARVLDAIVRLFPARYVRLVELLERRMAPQS